MFGKKHKLYFLFLGLHLTIGVAAQQPATAPISIRAALEMANQRKHSLQSSRYEAEAADKNVDVTRYIKRPAIDASYQLNIATANNLTGLFYPVGILPMTGPPSYQNSYAPVTGSAASLLLTWQAATFGQQNAQIDVSVAEAKAKRLGWEQEIFTNGISVISKYLDVLLAFEKVRIQEQNIGRVDVNLKQSRTLTQTGIRPGVDTALFLSELSKAKITWLDAKRQLATEQWLLAQLLVTDTLPLPTDTAILNSLPAIYADDDGSFRSHPLVRFAQSQVDVSQSKERLLRKSYLPKLTLFSTVFGRGSGVQPNGEMKTFSGLGMSRFNYGAGVQLAFPIMKYGEAKRQLAVQNLLTTSAQEALLENTTQLTTQQRIATETFISSLAVAGETAKQLKSAKYAFDAMQTRYTTGLANLSDLVQVQYNLVQAELDVKNAYWNTWKALLLQTAVHGDLAIFLTELK